MTDKEREWVRNTLAVTAMIHGGDWQLPLDAKQAFEVADQLLGVLDEKETGQEFHQNGHAKELPNQIHNLTRSATARVDKN